MACIFLSIGFEGVKGQKNALEQQITQQEEQIEALKAEMTEFRSKIATEELKETDNKLPLNEIKIEIEQADKASRNAERGTPVLMRVTAYDLSYESCKKNKNHPEYGIGASGIKVTENHSIAAGPEIPFGTKVFIPALKDMRSGGIYTVEDRGSAITENCLDIFLGESKHDECVEFGVQYLEVFVLDDLHESR